jgi:putative membrane protein
MLLPFLLLSWLANILSLAVADWLFKSVHIGHWWPLLLGAAVLGIANTIVKPIVTALALPLVILTLGIGLIAINVAMLALAEWIAPRFSINGFWTYVGATIVVWLVNWFLHGVFGLREDSRRVAKAAKTVL